VNLEGGIGSLRAPLMRERVLQEFFVGGSTGGRFGGQEIFPRRRLKNVSQCQGVIGVRNSCIGLGKGGHLEGGIGSLREHH
jgi:hypothetical protein